MFAFVKFLVRYLFADRPRHRHRKRPDIPSAQVLPLALVTEELQFTLFLIIEAIAVAHLNTQTSTYSMIVRLHQL